MYVRNKVLYLRKQGWIVDVISSDPGKILLRELEEFSNFIPELIFCIYCFSKKKRNQIVRNLVNRINDAAYNEIVIESTTLESSEWAEIVSSKIGAKHLVNLLLENNTPKDKILRDFLVFKHKRRELVSITKSSLLQMFKSFYPISIEESYMLPAYCNNVVADVDSPWINIIKNKNFDYIVGCLGRLEKPFMMYSIIDFCKFANTIPDKTILLLLMGGSTQYDRMNLKYKQYISKNANNVELMVTGFLYPVPSKLLFLCDALYATAGSAWVCSRSGIPTISYDDNDCRPIGILGRTTNSSLYRNQYEPVQSFEDLMTQILIEKKYKRNNEIYLPDVPDMSDHLEFLRNSSQNVEYYYFDSSGSFPMSMKFLKLKLMMIGARRYCMLEKIFHGGKPWYKNLFNALLVLCRN